MNSMEFRARGLLFDLDGTLIDSLPAVERAWTAWSSRHGLDPAEVLPRIHGRRSLDSVADILPGCDALAEDGWLRDYETRDTAGIVALPGALNLLSVLPRDSWAVVTSGTRDVASARMRAVGIEPPETSVYGDDVSQGKPHPEPFLLGAARLGLAPSECVAFEDAPGGLASAVAAACTVISVGVHWPEAAALTRIDRVVVSSEGVGLVVRLN